MSAEAIQHAILWHEEQIASLRDQLPKFDIEGAILAYAEKQTRPFNAAQVHREVCPWALRTGVNKAVSRLASKGKLKRLGGPGSVTAESGTKAAWYMRKEQE